MALQPNVLVFNVPFGSAGMEPRENRLLSHPIDLLDANGVTMEDDHVRKEAGATLFDSLRGMPSFDATLGTARRWDSTLLVFTAPSGGLGLPTTLGTDYAAAAASLALTIGVGGVPAGATIVITIATDSDTAGTNWSCTDTAGNTYTRVSSSATVTGLTCHTFYSIGIMALVSTNTITASVSAGTPAIAIAGMYATGITALFLSKADSGDDTGTDTTVVISPTTPYDALPKLLVANVATLGPDTDAYTPQVIFVDLNLKKGTTVTTHLNAQRVLGLNGNINGLVDFWPTATVQRLILSTTGGQLFKEVAGDVDAIELRRTLRGTVPAPKFVIGGKEAAANNRKLFFFNGFDPVQVLSGDGAATTALALPPAGADWTSGGNEPVGGIIHQNRLVGYGNANRPHTLYFSNPDDHEDFLAASAVQLTANSSLGDRIWSAVEFQGLLHIFKHPRGILFLDDSDILPINWILRTKSEGIGCAPTPHAVLPLDDDVLFLSADGEFQLLSAVQSLGGTRASSLSYALGLSKFLRENLDLLGLNETQSIWHGQKKTAYFYVPRVSSADIYTLKFDFGAVQGGGPVRFSYSIRDITTAACIRRDTDLIAKPLFAETAIGLGNVYKTERAARVKGSGDGYTGSIQTPHHDLSSVHVAATVGQPDLGSKAKLFEHLELTFEPVAAGELTVEVYVDFVLAETLTFDATRYTDRQKLHCGAGTTISLKLTNSTAAEDFKVLSATVWFKVGTEDERQ